jgi:hypothetical protein
MQILEDTVGKLRRAGAKKAIVGERHWKPENLDILNATLRGSLRGAPTGKVTLYREVNKDNVGKEDILEAALTNPQVKAKFAGPFANVVARGNTRKEPSTEKEAASAKKFSETVGLSRMSIKFLSFFNPNRTDLQRFIADTEFAVASMGYVHALHESAGTDQTRAPWRSSPERMYPAYLASEIGEATQVAMWGGLAGAQTQAPTIFVASTGILQQDGAVSQEEPAYFMRHYLEQGFAILVIHDVFVMAPATESFLSVLRAIATKYPGQAQLHAVVSTT